MTMRSFPNLDPALDHIRAAPKDKGTIELIARRPAQGTREIVERARFDLQLGVVGDGWHRRPSKKTGAPNPEQQVTLMNARAIAAIAKARTDWPNAGDQLYVDFDLSADNLPPGTRLAVGSAILEVSAHPHTGCAKFTARFGSDVTAWVNTEIGRKLNLRGINTRVIVEGEARTGDAIKKI